MRVTETLLATVVIALAAFVATQSATLSAPRDGEHDTTASGTLATSSPQESPAADSDNGAAADGSSDSLTGRLRRIMASGRAQGRLASGTEYIIDVPRDAAWPASEMRRRLAMGEAGTYIGELLRARDSVLTRWPDRRATPLRVWVGDGGTLEGWDATFPSIVRDAFDEWSQSGIPVRFTYVRDSASADVHVSFVPQFAQGISGRTIWSRDSTWWLVGGDIELALTHPLGGALNTDQMRAIALHEIGHLLGLDHVDDATNIMAPRVRVRTLSDTDRATVRLLYSVPAGSAR